LMLRRFSAAIATSREGRLESVYNLGNHSAPRNAPSKEGVPTAFGRIALLVPLINGFATTRTKSNMNPPSAVPDVMGTGT
jgi:hypothetical protein